MVRFFCPRGTGGLLADVPCPGRKETVGSGRVEVQCIMGNGHMETPLHRQMADRHD